MIWLLWVFLVAVNVIVGISLKRVLEQGRLIDKALALDEEADVFHAQLRYAEAYALIDQADLLMEDSRLIETGFIPILLCRPKHRRRDGV